MRLNDISLAASILLLVYTLAKKHTHVILAAVLMLFFFVLAYVLHWLANMDVNKMFMSRIDETIAFLDNGDLIYSYRLPKQVNGGQFAVVLKMKYMDTQNITRIDHPRIMIFTGSFTKTVTTEENIISILAAAINNNEAADMEGSIFFPWYIVSNQSIADTLRNHLAS